MNDIDLGKLRVNREGKATPKASGKRGLQRHHLLIGAGVLLLLYMLVPSAAPVQTTQVVTAWPSQQYLLLNSTGYVVARRKAAVASKGTGRVEWLGVSEGDTVKQGTVVARLESRDVEATYRAAAANTAVAAAALTTAQNEREDAQRNLDRFNVLFRKKLVSLLNMQDAKSRYARAVASQASAKAAVDAAKANEEYARSGVEYTQIRAPFDGVVISRSANVGDIVTPLSSAADAKGAVVVMADMSTLEVDAEVSESSLASIKVGQPCEIVLDAFPDRRYRGQVSVVVPTVNRSSATVTTKVRILDTDPSILPDMSARVGFLSQAVDVAGQKPVTAANPDAIAGEGDDRRVYAVDGEGRVREVPVKVGVLLGGVREIQGELKAGDMLVLKPGRGLRDGKHIKLAAAK
ncbi:efflux RND transporter periplasmic adaptor subunit [Solimonas sp. K1W22B-7]|uniref:efflux RND transporter periplasmic adaptor subunit n=1 Tax=Solimonas sp. K1W22B-7 TaxID=2303331 RepID=UPI000E3343F3|nr:efflux RND transporter periplasmic adaptor subunit [Solimonas sp. K1W22B-7]AXQ29253.1 efflux RND transporter periplasmic adaptor subunit [Solimonas sp. K1W22B-7]